MPWSPPNPFAVLAPIPGPGGIPLPPDPLTVAARLGGGNTPWGAGVAPPFMPTFSAGPFTPTFNPFVPNIIPPGAGGGAMSDIAGQLAAFGALGAIQQSPSGGNDMVLMLLLLFLFLFLLWPALTGTTSTTTTSTLLTGNGPLLLLLLFFALFAFGGMGGSGGGLFGGGSGGLFGSDGSIAIVVVLMLAFFLLLGPSLAIPG